MGEAEDLEAGLSAAAKAAGHATPGMQRPLHAGHRLKMSQVVELLGMEPDVAAAASTDEFAVNRVAHSGALAREGAHAVFVYLVQAGSFKECRAADDGYEHVIGFVWHAGVIGLDALAGERYAFSTEALEDSRVVMLPLEELPRLRREVPALDRGLHAAAARQLAHAGKVAEVMAAVGAETRLARFLLQLSEQMADLGLSPYRLLLRMTRRDIANHLGLAHETISRSFGVLARQGLLRVSLQDVEIVDLHALKRRALNTRRVSDDPLAATPHRPDPA